MGALSGLGECHIEGTHDEKLPTIGVPFAAPCWDWHDAVSSTARALTTGPTPSSGYAVFGWPRLTTPEGHRGVRSSGQMLPAELRGDGSRTFLSQPFPDMEGGPSVAACWTGQMVHLNSRGTKRPPNQWKSRLLSAQVAISSPAGGSAWGTGGRRDEQPRPDSSVPVTCVTPHWLPPQHAGPSYRVRPTRRMNPTAHRTDPEPGGDRTA